MQKLVFLLAMLFALPLMAQAQESPRMEIFGGYSYLRLDADTNNDQDLNGFNTSFTYNFNNFLGATGEVSGHYGNTNVAGVRADLNQYFFLFGPKFAFRGNERVTPFAHVLLGVVRFDVNQTSSTSSNTTTQFAMAVGGGLDINFNDRIAFRAVQADYILTRLANSNQHNFRASTGVVLKLGEQ
jgi:opacity protein-like surface antigen